MKYTIHAGHNPDGLVASGAAGFVKESLINRQIVNTIKSMMEVGNTAVDVTVNDGISQNDILKKLCSKMNNINASYNISVHCNAGGGTGIEAWTWGENQKCNELAMSILSNISAETGFKNRGVKHSKSLYILKHTIRPTIILEIGFVDNLEDAKKLMDNNIIRSIAIAIMEALGIDWDYYTSSESDDLDESNSNSKNLYRVQVGAFMEKSNAERLAEELRNDGYATFIIGGV